MSKKLNNNDLVDAANRLGIELAAIKAVTEVESRGTGFLQNGEPVILFERHWMHRLLRKKGITPPAGSPVAMMKAGGYKGGVEEHTRLQAAVEIDRECALQSASWGLFQIMGFHYAGLGYASIQEFVNAMYRSEQSQLDAFVRFIEADKRMHRALKEKNWLVFATAYNGPAQAKNHYEAKLKSAYEKHSK